MRFMMLVRANKDTEAGVLPSPEMFEAMGKYNEELVKAGVLLAADGLQPSSKGARISFDGGRPTVTDGPFAEAKELIAGYWVIQVKSKEEAVEWASRVPFADGEALELRQVFEAGDFPEEIVTPEAAASEARLREELERRAGQR
ncbi:hypothetical protein P3T37_003991 [Kitasatospora sp. MAA4]|uniref:YciI family protein n=1 Tax=Kitasatospora sp. MAA4 TaxID=3035093 RepID=UPI0024733110|nr:YciI family protein [Kitasatospora sp. MAA4]MDH6134587.1 hypothetical protein [Kitasatospora sp. MAA4]